MSQVSVVLEDSCDLMMHLRPLASNGNNAWQPQLLAVRVSILIFNQMVIYYLVKWGSSTLSFQIPDGNIRSFFR